MIDAQVYYSFETSDLAEGVFRWVSQGNREFGFEGNTLSIFQPTKEQHEMLKGIASKVKIEYCQVG